MAAADSFLFASATSLGHDILRPLGVGKKIQERNLFRACLIGMSAVGVLLALPFAEGSVVDWFFAFQPIAVAALVLPLLFGYGKSRLSTPWVLAQMTLSALVTVFWNQIVDNSPIAPVPPVVAGLLTSALIQLVGFVFRPKGTI
jgi:Na+/proline symporter